MASRTYFTDAILLRSVDYRDSDRIVTLLTPAHGKVSALARGARSSRRRFAGALQPCCVIDAEVAPGRGQLARLAQARVRRSFPGILASLRKMAIAGAGMELVREMTAEGEPEARPFDACESFLEALDEAAEARDELLIAFHARVLALVGLAPGLDTCASCGKRAAAGQAARFDPVRGAVVCVACGGGPLLLSGGTRARIAAASSGDWATQIEWEARERAQARAILDEVVACHLGRRLKGAGVIAQIDGVRSGG